MRNEYRQFIFSGIAMLLGYASWVLPRLLIPGADRVDLPIGLFTTTAVMTDVTQAWIYSLVCLILSGLIVGFLDPPHWLSSGGSTLFLVFIVTTLEVVFEIEPRHKLYGVEVIIFVIHTIPGIVGACLGQFIRRKFYPEEGIK